MTVGTVAYAAPEQLMGEDIDARADEYALAATAYHLFTGSQLFPYSNPAVVISRHLNSPPPALADSRPELAALDPVLAAGLAKDPGDRFPLCADFARAEQSREATTGSTPMAATAPAPTAHRRAAAAPAAPPSKKPHPRTDEISGSRKWWPITAAMIGVVVFAGAAVSIWRPWQHRSSTSGQTPSITPPLPPAIDTTQPSGTTSIAPPTSAPTTTSAPAPVPAFRTALPACYENKPIEEKPTSSNTACRMHWYENLAWTSWRQYSADGTGIEQLQNCTPACASGQIWRNPVEVHFSDPEPPPADSGCPGEMRFYTQLIVAYPTTPAPPQDALPYLAPVYTTYNGMPAYRWNSLTPSCTVP